MFQHWFFKADRSVEAGEFGEGSLLFASFLPRRAAQAQAGAGVIRGEIQMQGQCEDRGQ